jgi:hypothetical protein
MSRPRFSASRRPTIAASRGRRTQRACLVHSHARRSLTFAYPTIDRAWLRDCHGCPTLPCCADRRSRYRPCPHRDLTDAQALKAWLIENLQSNQTESRAISKAYGRRKEVSATLPRNEYIEIRAEKFADKDKAKWPEFQGVQVHCRGDRQGLHESRLPGASSESQSNDRDERSGRASRRSTVVTRPPRTQLVRILTAISVAVPGRLMKP